MLCLHNGILYSREMSGQQINILYIYINMCTPGASQVAHLAKNLPAMQETWVQPLGWEDPLEEGMTIYASILA